MATKVKSIDGLMRHLRDTHNIDIKGSIQKQKLRNIGYIMVIKVIVILKHLIINFYTLILIRY